MCGGRGEEDGYELCSRLKSPTCHAGQDEKGKRGADVARFHAGCVPPPSLCMYRGRMTGPPAGQHACNEVDGVDLIQALAHNSSLFLALGFALHPSTLPCIHLHIHTSISMSSVLLSRHSCVSPADTNSLMRCLPSSRKSFLCKQSTFVAVGLIPPCPWIVRRS